jgi:hypothetical protein
VCTPIGSKFSIEQMTTQLVLVVAHHLHLVLLPAEQAFLDEDFVDGREIEAVGDDALELLLVVGDAAAGAAQREARAG